MAISCVYCGETHPNPAEVRACWQRAQASSPTPERGAAAIATSAAIGAGPLSLGRNLVVAPGAALPAALPDDWAEAWAEAERVTITLHRLADPAELVAELRAAALLRQRRVIEIDTESIAALGEPQVAAEATHQLGARFEFLITALHHLVWSNSVDAVASTQPRWHLLERAVRLGATPVVDGHGDIELPDGTRLWIDGGPIRVAASIDGMGVVHRIALEHGSLVPFGSNDTTATTAAELATDQRAAVMHDGGAARIIAPAGSGKTRVLTERARHLLRQWRLPASAVCLVAFNKRAQEEMVERTRDLRGLQIRTLNAIALAIVNGSAPFAPRPQQLRTIDEGDVRRIIGKLVSFPRKRNADPVAVWIEALSLARLGMRTPTDVESLYDGEVDGFADVYPRYRAELARAGAVDFDEQIQLAIEILLTDPRARETAQHACRMLLVDEFQDLTPAHLLLIRLLAGPDGAVFGVGDDDQTIYGYNGADPAWLIDFDELFPGAGDHPLEVNYRCPGDVVDAADMLLRHNNRRVAKIIRADHPAGGFTIEPGGAPVDTTVRVVREALAAGVPAGDIAVLTRVNSMLAPVQVALRQMSIATTGGVGTEFAERTAVRSALAWLRLAIAGEQLEPADLAEALRRPSRPMHPNIANWVGEQRSVDGLRRLVGRITTERDALRVDEFTDDIERLQRITRSRGTTAGLLGALRDSMGLATTIASLDTHRRGMNRAAQNDDLTAIAQLAELQPDPREFEQWLRAGLQRSSEPGGVTLATVHRVKGQEWPIVVVHQAADDQFPHRLADDIEEERRVFHVAITRASRQLHVVPDATPSPFITECTTEPSARRSPPATTSRPVVSIPKSPAASAGKPGHDLTAAQSAVFEELRSLRRHLAAGKPAYTVFADAVLHEIAVAQPSTLGDLARIKGIGPNKLERYGSAILAVVESVAGSDA